MINLSEFMTQGSIFTAINARENLPFLDNGQAIVMDRMLTLKYGDRTVYDKMVSLSLNEISEMVLLLNGDMWKDLILFNDEIKTRTKGKTRTLTETVINSENRINVNDNKNLTTAYNDDSLIINDGTLANNTDDLTGNKTRTLTDNTVSLWDTQNSLSLSAKNNIINTVLKDVADFLTLNIY